MQTSKNNASGKTSAPHKRGPKRAIPVRQPKVGAPLKTKPGRLPKAIHKANKVHQTQQLMVVPTAIGVKTSVPVIAQFDTVQYSATFAAVYGYLAGKQLFLQQDNANNNATINAGSLIYLFDNMLSMIGGTTQTLTNAPVIAWDIIAALKSKSCRFLTYGHIVYSWGDLFPNLSPTIPTPGGTWEPTVVLTDNTLYNSPCQTVLNPLQAMDYTQFLQKLTDLSDNKRLTVVGDGYVSELSNDVSAFARSYVYNGAYISPSGGYYKDVENEVNITAPSLSSYGVYGVGQDLRAPLRLTPYSGDGATAFGHPLHPTFTNYFNKRPPSYKLIDFEWVYYTLCTYIVYCAQKTIAMSGTQIVGPLFNFSQQDFRIALRQNLMAVFDTQYFTQFITPLQFGSTDNGFAPFQVSGGSCPSPNLSHMLVPKLIQENLAALRARTYKNKLDKSLNSSSYVPVLGRYTNDTVAVFQYEGSDQSMYPLFSSPVQSSINLVNGLLAPNSYVNLNASYYQSVQADWNEIVGSFSAVSETTTIIIGDSGPPGLGILFYTAVQDVSQLALDRMTAPSVRLVRAMKHISNATRSTEKSIKGVTAIPPASIVSLTTIQTTTNFNYSGAVAALYDTLITPQIRLDINSPEDQLSLQMYQCEIKEPIATAWTNIPSPTGSGLASRLNRLALMCVPGIARTDSSEYASILEMLSLHNQAGMLSSILGGFAKSILPPDVHGIVDVVSDLVPF